MANPERNSLNSPLRIDSLQVPGSAGLIGMTLCPGKRGPSQFGPSWNRDLAVDLSVIATWGASCLVTVMESVELEDLAVGNLGAATVAAGLQWLQLPIKDGATPDGRFEARWPSVLRNLNAVLAADKNLVIHCRGGLGRTGMVVCMLLIEHGCTPAAALELVRIARSGTVETLAQEQFVLSYKVQSK